MMTPRRDAIDKTFMEMALALAKKSRPSPNPQVGAVVVKDGAVVGRGYHERPGTSHAEVNAIAEADGEAQGADLYVTLEPCVHHGRTGPCVEAILKAGIARVAVGMIDPDPRVNGAGVRRLKEAGVEVIVGVCEDACRSLLRGYATHRLYGRPYVTLKAAITLDGYLASTSGDSKWISSEASRTIAHEMRREADAVLVGVETVITDDPQLTVRHVSGKSPLRIVLDSNLRTPENAQIVTGAEAPTLLVHTTEDQNQISRYRIYSGVETLRCGSTQTGRVDLADLIERLAQRGVLALLVEAVLSAFVSAGIGDELVLFIAPRILGAGRSFISYPKAMTISDGLLLSDPAVTRAGPDVVYRVALTGPSKNR